MRQAIGLSLALWAVSGLALAKQGLAATDRHHQQSSKAKTASPAHPEARQVAARRRAAENPGKTRRAGVGQHRAAERLGSDNPSGVRSGAAAAVKVVGHTQIGIAAWYGGSRHVGQRTASGALLDTVTPTAAHRSLPLNSLVRITNLRNGKSVICTINDRGPWGANRLIDVSPRAADELDMRRSGIARVSVEPVARVVGEAD
jgi:rare lipoprotein A